MLSKALVAGCAAAAATATATAPPHAEVPHHHAAVAAQDGAPIAAVVVDQMRLAADYFIGTEPAKVRDDCGWEHSAFLQGVMALYDVTHDDKYKQYALAWAKTNKFETCDYPNTLSKHDAANWESCGQTYVELYDLDHDPSYISNVEEVLAVQVNRSQVDDWWWVDAFFMAMGTFSRVGNVTGDDRFHDKNFALFNDTASRLGLWSEEHGLFFRDATYINATTPSGQPVFWGRGNGWAAGAFARTLEFLSPNEAKYSALRSTYAGYLDSMATALAKQQRAEDGFWPASLLDPTQIVGPETTGTAGLTFGFAYGVNNGILDQATFEPMVLKAWEGLSTVALHPSGLVGHCQPVGGSPAPTTPTNTSDFCVGLFLLAASEVLKLAV